jgi:hypothetical protein
MSRSELVRFCNEYLPKHPELKAQIDARGDKQKMADGMAQAGAAAGYDFSADEILDVMKVAPAGELSDDQLEAVAGGRKAGKEQHEYLVVKLNEVLVTSWQTSS